MDIVAHPIHVELIERLEGRFGLALGMPKSREVMMTDQPLRRRMHGGAVEGLGNAPGAPALEGEVGPPIDDAIEVVALERGKPRVERVAHLFGGYDRHRMRTKMRIEGITHRVLVPILAQIHVTDLTERVHAGIGTSGSLDAHLLAAEARRGRPQQALDGRPVVLDLPADKWAAVIFHNQLIAGHGTILAQPGARPNRAMRASGGSPKGP